ncbi:putrescine transport system substrate-binding protein [Shimia isoporae]|uniref:Putrescine transport system substrate-binding protein n=1 Tax=Shimia isoporae TaxID=647720 RepID=A0A4R1N3R3_9RHOB|nr:extracellular solute-binding protein [Shimia isoporae]TCL00315.1 putrescine transport system substrate-binding protein [Shimia isoporae]
MRMTEISKVVLATVAIAQPLAADTDEIWFYNWSEFIDPAVLESFEEAHGKSVRVEQYGESNEAESRLAAMGTGYDLAVVGAETVGRLAEAGALQKFDPALAPNIADLDAELWDVFRKTVPEADGYAVPYLWGTTGLVFDREAVAERLPDVPTDSWALIYDPENAAKLADCGISIIDSNEEVVATVLAYLGKDPHSLAQDDLDAAFDVLASIAPYVRSYDTDQYDDLVEEKVCVSVTWSTEALGPMIDEITDKYEYVLPKEGANIWVDSFVLPVDSQNVTGAMEFLNHVVEPENLALSTIWGGAAISAPVTLEMVDWDVYNIPALTLPEEVRENLFFVSMRSSEQKRELDRRWRFMQIGM